MSYIDDFIKRAKEETARQIAKAEQHRVLEPIMKELIQQWNEYADYVADVTSKAEPGTADVTVAFSYASIECCSVNFHLSEDEGLKGLRTETVLKMVLDSDDFTFVKQHEYSEMHWIAWKFRHTNGSILMLRFWTGESKVCRYVPTGKMTEELKLVCEDAA